MKKEEFTNGIENFIIEEVAKHCKEVGKCANKILQDESLKKSISTILGNVDALYFKIDNGAFEQKVESEEMETHYRIRTSRYKRKKMEQVGLSALGNRRRRQLETAQKALDKYKEHAELLKKRKLWYKTKEI